MPDRYSPVTERDFRRPEFSDAEVEDYERCKDGTIARKDRWETAVRKIHSILGMNPRNTFEIADVIAGVRALKDELDQHRVREAGGDDEDDYDA